MTFVSVDRAGFSETHLLLLPPSTAVTGAPSHPAEAALFKGQVWCYTLFKDLFISLMCMSVCLHIFLYMCFCCLEEPEDNPGTRVTGAHEPLCLY